MARKYDSYPTPEVGQVWASADKREAGIARRVLAIEDGKALLDGHPRTRVRLDRMRPTSTGYRLLRDAQGNPYTHPDDQH